MALVLQSDSEDEEATLVRQSKDVGIVYVPPPVHDQSDEENIDDNIMEREDNDNGALLNDIVGEVEVEYQCDTDDDEDYVPEPEPPKKKRKRGKLLAKTADQPGPSTSAAQPEPPKYKSVTDFGVPKWSKKVFPYETNL